MNHFENQILVGVLAIAAVILLIVSIVGTILAIETIKEHRLQRKFYEYQLHTVEWHPEDRTPTGKS